MNWDSFNWRPIIKQQVAAALAEDILEGSDITAELLPADQSMTATLVSNEPAIICGTSWFNESFLQLDANAAVEWTVTDGEAIEAQQVICTIKANARRLLTAERTALNFLQTLSGTATTVYQWQKLLKGSHTQLLDTRKTIPGLRLAQKYAVSCGGGYNHRLGVWDAYLIKENHIAGCGSIEKAITTARHRHPEKPIEVEVETLDELKEAIAAGADTIMLDNFNDETIAHAVKLNQGRAKLEVSGNIEAERLIQLAQLGVDFISSGALTKHVRAIDFSLRSVTQGHH